MKASSLTPIADLDTHIRKSHYKTLMLMAGVMALGIAGWMVAWRLVLPTLFEEGILFDAVVVLMSFGVAYVISNAWKLLWEREEVLLGAADYSHVLQDLGAHPELLENFLKVYETQGKRLLLSQFLFLKDEMERRSTESRHRKAEEYVESILKHRLPA